MQLQTNRGRELFWEIFIFFLQIIYCRLHRITLHLDRLSAMECFICLSRPLKTYEYLISLHNPNGEFSSGNKEMWFLLPSKLALIDLKD